MKMERCTVMRLNNIHVIYMTAILSIIITFVYVGYRHNCKAYRKIDERYVIMAIKENYGDSKDGVRIGKESNIISSIHFKDKICIGLMAGKNTVGVDTVTCIDRHTDKILLNYTSR